MTLLSNIPPAPNRLLPACAAALLGTWCVFGGWITVGHFTGEKVKPYYAHMAGSAVVGIPGWWDPADVAALRSTLASQDRTDGIPWLVLYPSDTPSRSLQYIRAQLAYFEYPSRVDVLAVGAPLPGERYAGIITPPSVELANAGEPLVTTEGFRIYRGFQR